MARGRLAAEYRHAGRAHRHREGGAMPAPIHARVGADVHVLGIGRAGVHAHLAAQDEARIRLPNYAKRGPLLGVLTEAVADGGGARAEREETPGARDEVAIARGDGELLRRDLPLQHDVANAQGDEVAVARGMRHVPRRGEYGRRITPAHGAEIGRAPRRGEGPWRARARRIRRAEEQILPGRIVVAVVPRHVLFHHRAGEGMERDVLDQALADHPDAASVAQGLPVLATRPHRRSSSGSSTWTVSPESGLDLA